MMKKLIFMLVGLFALIVSSCTNEASLQGVEPQVPEKSAIRTEEEAIIIAQRFANNRNNSRSAMTVSNVTKIYSSHSRSNNTPVIYAVNFDDNGYVLVSAAKEGQDILGHVETGSFDEKEVIKNDNFSYYLNFAKSYVESNLTSSSLNEFTPIKNPDSSWVISHVDIGPYVSVSWGQANDESQFCSNGICGHQTIAIGMILSFLQKPSSIKLTYENRDKETQVLNWSEINKHKYSDPTLHSKHIQTTSQTPEIHKTIARLIRQIGKNMGALYVPGFTFIDSANLISGLTTTYSDAKVTPLENCDAVQMLQNMRTTPGVYCMLGQNVNDISDTHTWIYDGGYVENIGYRGTTWDGKIETGTRSASFSHFRWGFGGLHDGYFYPGVFNVDQTNYSQILKCFFVKK